MANVPLRLVIAVASLSLITYAAYTVVKQRSLQRGITQTEQAIKHVDAQLQENDEAIAKLFLRLNLDATAAFNRLTTDSHEFADAVQLFKAASTSYEASRAMFTANHNRMLALQKTSELIAQIWGKLDPRMAFGKALVNVAANVFETQMLLRQQARLLEIHLTFEQQLARLRSRDPERIATWDDILRRFQDNSAVDHAGYEKWLADRGVSKQVLIKAALKDASTVSCDSAIGMLRGATIVDPEHSMSDIESMPGINPDFVAALKYERSHINDPNYLFSGMHMRSNKYPDGRYIPIFLSDPTAMNNGQTGGEQENCPNRVSVDASDIARLWGFQASSEITNDDGRGHVTTTTYPAASQFLMMMTTKDGHVAWSNWTWSGHEGPRPRYPELFPDSTGLCGHAYGFLVLTGPGTYEANWSVDLPRPAAEGGPKQTVAKIIFRFDGGQLRATETLVHRERIYPSEPMSTYKRVTTYSGGRPLAGEEEWANQEATMQCPDVLR